MQQSLERLEVLLGDLDRRRSGGAGRAPHRARLGSAAAGEHFGPPAIAGALAAAEPADQQADRQHDQADLQQEAQEAAEARPCRRP